MGVYARQDSPYWWITVTRPGRRPLVENTKLPKVGATPKQTKQLRQDAEEAYKARAADLARANYELPPRQATSEAAEEAKTEAITVASWLDWYQTHVSSKKPGHDREIQILDVFREYFRFRRDKDGTFELDEQGHKIPLLLKDLTKTRYLQFRTHRLDGTWRDGARSVIASTVNRETNLMGDVLKKAVPDHLEKSPIERLRRLKEKKFKARAATSAQERRILAELRPRDQALYLMGVDTLMRLGDIFDAEWEYDRGDHYEVPDSKNDESYKAPISTRLRAALDHLPRTSKYIFPHRRVAKLEADRRKAVRLMLMRACQRANVPYGQKKGGVTWHSVTRHTGATRMVEANVSLRTIQEIGNWKTLSQLQKYGHPSEEAKRVGVEAVGGAAAREELAAAAKANDDGVSIGIARRVRHRPDLDALYDEGIAAWRGLIAQLRKRPPRELRKITVVLRGYYAAGESPSDS